MSTLRATFSFYFAYEPIIEPGSGRVMGFEQLARCQPHPDAGWLASLSMPQREQLDAIAFEAAIAAGAAFGRQVFLNGFPESFEALAAKLATRSGPGLSAGVVLEAHETVPLAAVLRVLARYPGLPLALDDVTCRPEGWSALLAALPEAAPLLIKTDPGFVRKARELPAHDIQARMASLPERWRLIIEGAPTCALATLAALGVHFASGRELPGQQRLPALFELAGEA